MIPTDTATTVGLRFSCLQAQVQRSRQDTFHLLYGSTGRALTARDTLAENLRDIITSAHDIAADLGVTL